MQVILTKNIPGLGYTGDMKNVKPGFFRNYLFPNAKAIRATDEAIKKFEAMKDEIVKQKQELIEKAQGTLAKLKNITLVFNAKASDKGTLYGSITEDDVIKKIKEVAKMELDKNVIAIDGGHIKTIGKFTATVRLTESHKGEVNIDVRAVDEK